MTRFHEPGFFDVSFPCGKTSLSNDLLRVQLRAIAFAKTRPTRTVGRMQSACFRVALGTYRETWWCP